MASRLEIRDMAEKEYYSLHDAIHKYDDSHLKIKGWSVTVGIAAIGASYINSTGEIVFLSSLSALLFWYVEVLWKNFQLTLMERALLLEDFLHGKTLSLDSPRIYHLWLDRGARGNKISDLLRISLEKNVFMPHLFIVLFPLYYHFKPIRMWIGGMIQSLFF